MRKEDRLIDIKDFMVEKLTEYMCEQVKIDISIDNYTLLSSIIRGIDFKPLTYLTDKELVIEFRNVFEHMEETSLESYMEKLEYEEIIFFFKENFNFMYE